MNGNWNGISNQRYSQEQIHQKVSNMYQDGAEPSIDVINTIVSCLFFEMFKTSGFLSPLVALLFI